MEWECSAECLYLALVRENTGKTKVVFSAFPVILLIHIGLWLCSQWARIIILSAISLGVVAGSLSSHSPTESVASFSASIILFFSLPSPFFLIHFFIRSFLQYMHVLRASSDTGQGLWGRGIPIPLVYFYIGCNPCLNEGLLKGHGLEDLAWFP